jgi:hypothetical protein
MKSFLKNINQQFLSAPKADKKVVLNTLFWSVVVRFCMCFVPFKFYKNMLGKQQAQVQKDVDTATLVQAKHISTLVLAVCRHTPWKSECLVQAIACRQVLLKKGIPTTLYLGLAKDQMGKKIRAHAWLKAGDIILTGARGHRNFKIVNFYG